jgi:Transposase DDE domain group 1
MSAISGNPEYIYSYGILPPVTQFGTRVRRICAAGRARETIRHGGALDHSARRRPNETTRIGAAARGSGVMADCRNSRAIASDAVGRQEPFLARPPHHRLPNEAVHEFTPSRDADGYRGQSRVQRRHRLSHRAVTTTAIAICRCTFSAARICWRQSCGAAIDASAGAVEETARIVAQIRAHWPEVRIVLRADSGFAREALTSWCEANGVDYLFGLAKNKRLVAEIADDLAAAEEFTATACASMV